MSDQAKSKRWVAVLRALGSVLLCLLLLGAAAGAVYWIYNTEPTAQREGATRKTAALVETIVVSRGDYRPDLVVLGNVQPARSIALSPRVSGEIIAVDPSFVPGGIVDQGQPLLTIDPADFENVVTLRRAALKQAEAQLAIEQGRQAVARKELEALGREIAQENRALVLREPQIASIRAQMDSARAALDQAELDLERTRVAAPFDAQIMSRSANLGSQVGAGDEVARLVGVDEYWVIASVPLRHLGHIALAGGGRAGSSVRVRLPSVWGPDAARTGEVIRLIGELDPQARLAQVLISVRDPLSRDTEGPTLLLDTIVEATIAGKPLEGVIRLPRDYLRQNNSVWVFNGGKLAIRRVQTVFGNAEYAYVSEGLEEGDEVVTTALATVVEGRPLRRVTDAENDSDEGAGDAASGPGGGE